MSKTENRSVINLPEVVIKELEDEMLAEFDRLCDLAGDAKFEELEKITLKIRNEFGKKLLEKAIESRNSESLKKAKECPNCDHSLESRGRKKKL